MCNGISFRNCSVGVAFFLLFSSFLYKHMLKRLGYKRFQLTCGCFSQWHCLWMLKQSDERVCVCLCVSFIRLRCILSEMDNITRFQKKTTTRPEKKTNYFTSFSFAYVCAQTQIALRESANKRKEKLCFTIDQTRVHALKLNWQRDYASKGLNTMFRIGWTIVIL